MDKKFFQKSSNFLKKEGFYVILFVCLCIIASVAAITTRNSKLKTATLPNSPDKEVAMEKKEETKKQLPNADMVKKITETNNVASKTEGSKTTPVANTSTKLTNPVKGDIVRAYSYPNAVWCETMGHYRSMKGIDISVKVGTDVLAVAEGVVEEVDNDKTERGQYVVIKHANGLLSVYSNLDEKVSVKKGDKVKQNQPIGKVGKTATTFSEEKYGDHLNFQLINTTKNEQVDPTSYLSLKVAPNNK